MTVGAITRGSMPNALPFDLARAHELYKALFGGVEDLIRGQAPADRAFGPLTRLPFQVLVTGAAPPAKRPLTPMPRGSPGAPRPHRAARRVLAEGAAPARQGEQGDTADDRLRQSAARWSRGTGPPRVGARQSCANRQGAACRQPPCGPGRPVFPRGLADAELIRRQPPLPETADELCAVARSTGAAESADPSRRRATEREVKGCRPDGALARSRVRAVRHPWPARRRDARCSMPRMAEPA